MRLILIGFGLCFCLCGCVKNETRFYEDNDATPLSIFSNTGNNIMSCYLGANSWRTFRRVQTSSLILGTNTSYEVSVNQQLSTSFQNFSIRWQGYYNEDQSTYSNIYLNMSLPGRSFRQALMRLQRQRFELDTTTGNYFTLSETNGQPGVNGRRGKGSIYFQTLQIDSVAPSLYSGKMAGIFEADFGTLQITKGRFDHLLLPDQFR